MYWAIPFVISVAGGVAIFASQPAKKLLAGFAALLMIVSGAWSSYFNYQQSRAAGAVSRHAYSDLNISLGKTIELLDEMLIAGSDGWLPTTNEERFSERAADTICKHLNVESRAPVVPHRSWLSWIDEQTREIREELEVVYKQQGTALDPEVLDAVASLRYSFFFTFPGQWSGVRSSDRKRGVQWPPLLCKGITTLMRKSLEELGHAFDVIREETGHSSEPLPIRGNVEWHLGASHYGSSDLRSWEVAHPNAPSLRTPADDLAR